MNVFFNSSNLMKMVIKIKVKTIKFGKKSPVINENGNITIRKREK